MSKITTLDELYLLCLRDLYSAENQMIGALPKVATAAQSPELKDAVLKHLKQTENQVGRLNTIFALLGQDAGGHECAAMKGLIQETNEMITDVTVPELLDAALIGAAQKVEHYEISGYGTARTFARLIGHDDHAKILQQTLDEEATADQALTELADQLINAKAARQPVGAAI